MTPEQLFDKHQSLAMYLFHKKCPLHDRDEDMKQWALLGLWRACITYQEDKGRFSTYAGTCIQNSMWSELRKRRQYSKLGTVSLDAPIVETDDAALSLQGMLEDHTAEINPIDWDGIAACCTARQQRIVRDIVRGFRQGEIAKRESCTQTTVSKQVRKIRELICECV